MEIYVSNGTRRACLSNWVGICADTDKECNNGTTALIFAALNGHLEIVRLLLQEGADKDKENNNGATPLMIASRQGHLDIVWLLLQEGADKDKADINGVTPLHFASVKGHTDIAKLLLLSGADKERKDKFDRKALDLCPTEEMRAELEETVSLRSSGSPVRRRRRRRGRSCACCEVQEADGVGAVRGWPSEVSVVQCMQRCGVLLDDMSIVGLESSS